MGGWNQNRAVLEEQQSLTSCTFWYVCYENISKCYDTERNFIMD